MGLSFEDYLPQLTAAKVKAATEKQDRERVRKGRDQQIREILSDPRWDLYAQQIEERLALATSALNALSQRLLGGQETTTYVKVLAEYRYYFGLKEGLEIALALAKDTVNK